jgi:hypothetical protein
MANSLTSLADEAMDDLGYPLAPRLASTARRDGALALNRNSTYLIRDHEFPPAKVCLPSEQCLISANKLRDRLCCTEQAYETNTRYKRALK